ncbi:MAG: hypothetical protein JRI83_04875 [Deltaproteobacteria bacterium]|nr:hypothetical protein [Deltaproteobacteria bacterium]
MNPTPEEFDGRPEALDGFLGNLDRLYAEMDQAYSKTAADYGFYCTGCRESCCRTRFFHYTFLEYHYLLEGYRKLAAHLRQDVLHRAGVYQRRMENSDAAALSFDAFCPLNDKGACILYAWRPMICRLHGIPYELHTPGKPVLRGPGCPVFTQTFGAVSYVPFDRTPFYKALAALEQNLRKTMGVSRGIKMTVAGMLLDFDRNASRKPRFLRQG